MSLAPGTRLGVFTLIQEIGRGGMGEVYRARDTKLDRDVAIKVLPEAFAHDAERLARFLREAKTLASLNHPNIAAIYGLEASDGIKALVMELVEGDDLSQRIVRGAIPLDDALPIARQIAEALEAAHEQGIIHRDLKAANIKVRPDGMVKVLDFGLAKMRADASTSSSDSATYLPTQVGVVLGTPAYMSPEQVSGLDVDHRTDVFSLGVLLYEMLTGARPFAGRSQAELATAILRDAPAPMHTRHTSVPSEVVSVVMRCLEKDLTRRFASMAEVQRALRGSEPHESRRAQGVPARGPSVAVMPFKNLNADPDSEFFSEGLAEEILNALAQIDGLRVAARTSSFSFKGKGAELGEIGAKLGVATVLDGSVRRAGNRIRVTTQLVDVANGFQIWSERYDRELADIFDVQDEIARAIAAKLKVTLASGSQRLVKQGTSNLEAYELYLRGRALLLKRGRFVAEGTECMKRAVELDPNFAAAWAGLADTFSVRGYMGIVPPAEAMPKALSAARRAVELDPLSAEAHCAFAMPLMLWERDYQGSDSAFRRSLELNPHYVQGLVWHGLFSLQWVQGRLQEGAAEVRRALEIDPLSAYAASMLGLALYPLGEAGEALRLARLGVERDADSFVNRWVLGIVAHWVGRFEESVEAFEASAAASNRSTLSLAYMAATYSSWSKPVLARELYDELRSQRARGYVACSSMAVAAAASGDLDAAVDFAQQACDERDPFLVLVARLFPEPLREDPRFAEVLRRLALPKDHGVP